ncbi:MAG: hypothetical protein ACRELV_06495 [Longimicrobiales bacterium]
MFPLPCGSRSERILHNFGFAIAVIFLASCADEALGPGPPSASLSTIATPIRHVPALEMDVPEDPSPWVDVAKLRERLAAEEGHAIIAFKELEARRVLTTGTNGRAVRAAVSATAIRRGFALLDSVGVTVLDYLDAIGAAQVVIDPALAVLLIDNPSIDYIAPRQWSRLVGISKPAKRGLAAETLNRPGNSGDWFT